MAGYRALYRTWRPHRFAEVVGQEHVTRTLRNALVAGRLGHAYLFCGPRGTGKTSVARILAQAANCLRPEAGDPCGHCENCTAIAADRFLDLQEIDGATNRGIDEVRGLREDARYAAIAGRTKVYIIDEVHMLTEAAWNALLKTLEEPPERTLFVMATTDPRKIPLTALSRCQRFDFHRLAEDQIAGRLMKICTAEDVALAPETLAAIARRAGGALRDALSLLDQGLAYAGADLTPADVAAIAGAGDEETLARILTAVAAGDAAAAMQEVERLHVTGRDFGQAARDLAAALRDRLVALLARGAVPPAPDPLGSALALWTDPARVLAAVDALAAAESDMRRSAQPRFVLEVALLRLLSEAWPPAAATPEPHSASASTAAGADAAPVGAAPETAAAASGANEAADPPHATPSIATEAATAAAGGAQTGRPSHSPSEAAPPPTDATAEGDPLARWPVVLDALKPPTREIMRWVRPVQALGRRLTLETGSQYDVMVRRKLPEVAAAVVKVLGDGWSVEIRKGRVAVRATPELAAQMFDGEVVDPGAQADPPRRRRGDPPF